MADLAMMPDVPDYDDKAFADFKEEPPAKADPTPFLRARGNRARQRMGK
jgi:hypothetical protein